VSSKHKVCIAAVSAALAIGGIAPSIAIAAPATTVASQLAELPKPGAGCSWSSYREAGSYDVTVSLRAKPSIKSKRLAIIPTWTLVDYFEYCPRRGYVRAVYNGKLGFVSNDHVGFWGGD